jgi:hypothetical protein
VVVGVRSGGWVTVGTGTGELDGGDIVVVVGEVGLGPPLPGGVEVVELELRVVDAAVKAGLAPRPPVAIPVVPVVVVVEPAERCRDLGGVVAAPDRGPVKLDGDGRPPWSRVVDGSCGRPRSSWPWLAA